MLLTLLSIVGCYHLKTVCLQTRDIFVSLMLTTKQKSKLDLSKTKIKLSKQNSRKSKPERRTREGEKKNWTQILECK